MGESERIGTPTVGYLSELEPLRYISVGTMYKHPELPFWVLGSSTHYTLLFSVVRSDSQLSEGAMLDQRSKKVFVENSIDDGGIAMASSLGQMLEALNIPASRLGEATLDLNREDIVVWPDFRSWVRRVKGVAQDSEGSGSGTAAGETLNLFLYDGQDPPGPSLRRITIEPTDVDPRFAGGGDENQFEAMLHTRWPNALISVRDA